MKSMTFEQWKKRPVYVAQCATAALANELGVFCFMFRALPKYRNAQAKAARLAVATEVRTRRKVDKKWMHSESVKSHGNLNLCTKHQNLASELS